MGEIVNGPARLAPGNGGPVIMFGRVFLSANKVKKMTKLLCEIEEHEEAAAGLVLKTAQIYFNVGNILCDAIMKFPCSPMPTVKSIAEATGLSRRRITLSLKIYKAWEHSPAALKSLSLRDAVKLISPPEDNSGGYNRIDFGGDPGRGQAELDFGELFEIPTFTGAVLKDYRVTSALLSEIVVVRRTGDGQLVSKRFVRFAEDIPQDPSLRTAFKAMAEKTQAAVENYLGVVEQYEQGGSQ
ncbi:MAG: hypothetical protein LBI67_12220 [Treponema sp.]|jgi:hypothetical protein|nr:hypothetical protein [Treponema sp.]